jgi:Domain of unknown function (DUF4407)
MITNFLILCSGANKKILDQCVFEKTKYIGIGLTNVLIAMLSSISVGFFVAFAFTDKQTGRVEIAWYSLLAICVIWGLLIFNLDRNIIISIQKTGTKKQQFIQAIPRILIAVFIGIVISTPLELKIFSDEIKVQLEKNLKEDVKEMKSENLKIHSSALKRADSILAEQENALKQKDNRRNQLYSSFIGEVEGTSGTGRPGKGPVFSEKRAQYELADSAYKVQYNVCTKAKEIRDSIQARISNSDSKDEGIINDVNGPSAQIVALHQLPGVHWFVTILFILLETMPVIVKLMSKRGLYDEILERIEAEVRFDEELILADKKSKKDYKLKEIDELNRLESELRLTRERRRIAAEMEAIEDKKIQTKAEVASPSILNGSKLNKQAENAKVTTIEPIQSDLLVDVDVQSKKDSPVIAQTIIESANEPVETFSFENKIWKDKNSADGMQYSFMRKGDFKTLSQKKNGIEKNGNWDYRPNQNRLQMEMDGNHREYDIISVTPTALELRSMMGKPLSLLVT